MSAFTGERVISLGKRKSIHTVFPYIIALSALLSTGPAFGAEQDVEEIETPPPAVKGATETKKMPDQWKLKKSTEMPTQEQYPEPPSPKTDRGDECHSSHGWRTREALGCDD